MYLLKILLYQYIIKQAPIIQLFLKYTIMLHRPSSSQFMDYRNQKWGRRIDTQRQFSEAKKLLNEVEKINKPILGVIITHPHQDHINGAAALLNETANVPIYATQSTFNIMKKDTGGYIALSKQLLPRNEYSNQVILPNRIVKSGENITIDRVTYHFESLGIGEAGDMMVIYLPSQKMMFTGDIVNNHMHPFFAGAVSPESS
jgi:glyoxylase-like metal-dependent hydrolase (beta-lactamase superfamily II)